VLPQPFSHLFDTSFIIINFKYVFFNSLCCLYILCFKLNCAFYVLCRLDGLPISHIPNRSACARFFFNSHFSISILAHKSAVSLISLSYCFIPNPCQRSSQNFCILLEDTQSPAPKRFTSPNHFNWPLLTICDRHPRNTTPSLNYSLEFVFIRLTRQVY